MRAELIGYSNIGNFRQKQEADLRLTMKTSMKSIFSKKTFVLCMNVLSFQFFAAGAHAMPVPDTTFGTNGVALIRRLSGTGDQPTASALQSDGKLLVAGDNSGRYSHGFVLRLLAGGGLDTTFGQDGFAYMPPEPGLLRSIYR